MRILILLVLLLILFPTAGANIKIVSCFCKCPGPDGSIKVLHTNGTEEGNCQETCGGLCGGMSSCGLNPAGTDCDTCCGNYCYSVTPAEAKTSCIDNCLNVCGVKSLVMETVSMFSYIAVAIAVTLFAICGIRFLTADDPESRDTAKKCILYIIIALVIIGIASLIVALFAGPQIGGGGSGAGGISQLSDYGYTANC